MEPKDIIDALGGARKVARDIGLPVSTVQSWKRVNKIPDWRRAAIDKLAEESPALSGCIPA